MPTFTRHQLGQYVGFLRDQHVPRMGVVSRNIMLLCIAVAEPSSCLKEEFRDGNIYGHRALFDHLDIVQGGAGAKNTVAGRFEKAPLDF